MLAEELKINLGLTVTQDIVNSKQNIDTIEHKTFIEGVKSIFETLFTVQIDKSRPSSKAMDE